MKKIISIAILSTLLIGCSTETITYQEAQQNQETQSNKTDQEEALPQKLILDVPFISQAPHANWDDPYQEACEEASMIMVYNYLKGISNITPDQADKQILDLVDYETSIGLPYDINTFEMQEVIQDYYSMDSTILTSESINVEEFKKQISQGNPIIIPAQGQQLNNPNFSNGGPEYHMLVIIGYDDKKELFITNDPGTRNGKQYEYSYETILDAIHDWTGDKSTVYKGEKRAIILTSWLNN